MNTFDTRLNAIGLRHAVAAIIEVYGSQKVDLSEFPEEKMQLYMAAIDDLDINLQSALELSDWFEENWALFPFSNRWESLQPIHKQMVASAYNQCRAMTAFHGTEV
jgi:hypothetical protein